MTVDQHAHIAALVAAVADARGDLADAIRAVCPRPHAPVQHRDRRPPWCEACGYTDDGTRIKERS